MLAHYVGLITHGYGPIPYAPPMAWQNLDEDLDDLFNSDAEHVAEVALEQWCNWKQQQVKVHSATQNATLGRKVWTRNYQRQYSKSPQRRAYMTSDKMLSYMRDYQRVHRLKPEVLEAKRAYQRDYNKRKRQERKALINVSNV